jgi:hypothetical protein
VLCLAAAGTAAFFSCALALLAQTPATQPTAPASAPADPSPQQQKRIYFPKDWPRQVKAFQDDGIIIWTDADGLDGEGLLEHLQAVRKYLEGITLTGAEHGRASSNVAAPSERASAPARPVAIAIYQDQTDYQALWRRVGEHYGGQFDRIVTQGFSYRVFCASSFGDKDQFQRRLPVICHEFTHVWLFQRLGLSNDANWLTEGIASAVQLHFFPQAGDRQADAQRVREGRYVPLKRLLEQQRTAPAQYWQAASLVEMILKDRPTALPRLIAAQAQGKDTAARLRETLEVDFPGLEKRWAAYVIASATSQPTSTPSPAREYSS